MSIRNFCNVPDDRVPDFVRRAREASRAAHRREQLRLCSCRLHFASRGEVLAHCDATGHPPLVTDFMDPFIKRPNREGTT